MLTIQYPKIIKVGYDYSYSCQICQKFIIFPDKCYFEPDKSPVCSEKCLFRLLYRILKSYDKKDIDYLKKYYSIEDNEENKQNNALFLITKLIINTNKNNLSTIKDLSVLSICFLIILIIAYNLSFILSINPLEGLMINEISWI